MNRKLIKLICIIIPFCMLVGGFIWLDGRVNIPHEEYHRETVHKTIISPDGRYEIQMSTLQKYKDGGDILIAEHAYLYLSDSEHRVYKDIYYGAQPITEADLTWIDEETLQVKDRILNLPHDVYDYRIHWWK